MIFLDVGSIIALFVYNAKNGSDQLTDIIITTLLLIFNVPVLIHFTAKAIKMLMFRKKLDHFMADGKKFRAAIIDERLGKPLYKSETNTVDTYHPIVKFFDSSVQREVTLISELPLCASYRDALVSNIVTIYVIGNSFLISEFYPAETAEYSIDRRDPSLVKLKQKIVRIENQIQLIYAVGAVIALVLTFALQLLLSWIAHKYL